MTENVSKADDDHYEKRRCSDYKIFLETNREGKKMKQQFKLRTETIKCRNMKKGGGQWGSKLSKGLF